MIVNVLCRNAGDDRVIPRFSRYLSNYLGWTLTTKPLKVGEVDLMYLSGYFESQIIKPFPPQCKTAAYFTHRETQPPGNAKAKLFDRVAKQVDLRIATAAMYADYLQQFGDTVQINPPVERHRFTIAKRKVNNPLVVGFSGYSYSNGRKGEGLAGEIVRNTKEKVRWVASGRGWPVVTRKYSWNDMVQFYQMLDILIVTATVEGNPMPPLEVMACGGSVVIPRGVGLLDELPDAIGIHRYKCGSSKEAIKALKDAIRLRREVNREELRAITEPYSITAWCEQHRQAFEGLCYG